MSNFQKIEESNRLGQRERTISFKHVDRQRAPGRDKSAKHFAEDVQPNLIIAYRRQHSHRDNEQEGDARRK
jgi:hypothetical protein